MRLVHRFLCAASLCAAACVFNGCATSAQSASADAVLAKPRTGMIQVEGGRVWYKIAGSGRGTPLLVLHGGPGIPHNYLANLDQLGGDRPVVFYDQLGCGLSDRPDDPALWTRERFCREVGQVRDALGLDDLIIYGHSWGSILAVDYVSGMGGQKPVGVKGLVLAGPALDIPRWIKDSRRLIADLPPATARAILEGERTGQTDTDAYHDATGVFYSRHVCRLDPWPDDLNAAFEGMGEQVYFTMNGPSEFTITGPLKDVDVTTKLATLGLPVLYVCGQHDEATPESARHYADLTPRADLVVIPNASHCANFEQPETYMRTLRSWFRRQGF